MPGPLHPDVYCCYVHNRQTVEGASASIKTWMNKEDLFFVYNGILLSHYKRKIRTIFFDVVGTEGCYAKWKKSFGERQTFYGLIHLWNIKIVKGNKGGRRKVGKYQKGKQNMRDSTLGNELGVLEGDVGVLGWLGDRHWGGHLTGWAPGVILHVGKLNTNKK